MAQHFFGFGRGCIVFLLFVSFHLNVKAYESGKTYKLRILHTNDTHGHLEQFPALMSKVQEIRKSHPDEIVLLLSAGDINTGTPVSDFNEAIPDIQGMNLMKYDAAAIGNHEFDKSADLLQRQMKLATFPLLSANILEAKSGEKAFPSYAVKDYQGLKIAYVGATTEETPSGISKAMGAQFTFVPPAPEVQKVIDGLKAGKEADVVIVLSHLGYYPEGSGPHFTGDRELARLVSGIDLIVGGHTQIVLPQPVEVEKTKIIQAGEYGKYLGMMEADFKDGVIQWKKYELIPMTAESPKDPEMVKLISPYEEKLADQLREKVGQMDQDLKGEELAKLVIKAHKKAAVADVAAFDPRGLRAELKAGTVTHEDIFKILPFGNTLCTVDLEADEYRKYVEGKGTTVMINEVSLQGKTTVRLAANSFLANGGNGNPDLSKHPTFRDTGLKDAWAVINYLKNH